MQSNARYCVDLVANKYVIKYDFVCSRNGMLYYMNLVANKCVVKRDFVCSRNGMSCQLC